MNDTLMSSTPAPQIIIKGEEVAQFNKLLDELSHEGAKKVIAFVNKCQLARHTEVMTAQQNSQIQMLRSLNVEMEKELEELRKYKANNEKTCMANKYPSPMPDVHVSKTVPETAITYKRPSLNVDEGEE